MDRSARNWPLSRIGRRSYFICQAALLAVSLFGFEKTVPPASLILFMGRSRDAGDAPWTNLGLGIVGLELFLGPIGRWAIDNYGRSATGYAMLALVVVHVLFAVMLGLQRPQPAA